MSTAAPLAITVNRHRLSISNPDKALYPDGFTKKQVVDYYLAVAPIMLPHIKDRAVTLKRYPNGSMEKFFFEKRCPSHKPDWVKTACIVGRSDAGEVCHCLLNDAASLVWAANLASLELHVPLAKAASPDRPTCMVFDLDPGAPATIKQCAIVALRMRQLFDSLKMRSVVKTTGKKGLHLYVPLNTPCDFEQTKRFAESVAMLFEKDDPKGVTSTMKRDLRGGKVFVDWSQNDRHKTTAAVYTLRAMETPSVSTPVSWDEVTAASKGTALMFSPDDVIARVGKLGDLFEPLLNTKQKLPKAEDLG